MLLGLTLSVVEQLTGKSMTELTENDDDTAEKDSKMEKDIFTFKCNLLPSNYIFLALAQSHQSLIVENDKFQSELYASLPELPPEL